MSDTNPLSEPSINRDLLTDSIEITHLRPPKPAVVSSSTALHSYRIMWFMASATANRYGLVADLDEHIKFEGSGWGVRKEYLLNDFPTELV